MITCTLIYKIDPYQVAAFETYARAWIHLVNAHGGTHHGYWLPHEGPNDVAFAKFSFPSLAAYETYRAKITDAPECQAVMAHAEKTRCILSFERSFTRPVLTGATPAELGLTK